LYDEQVFPIDLVGGFVGVAAVPGAIHLTPGMLVDVEFRSTDLGTVEVRLPRPAPIPRDRRRPPDRRAPRLHAAGSAAGAARRVVRRIRSL
jgi:hypothetical protein